MDLLHAPKRNMPRDLNPTRILLISDPESVDFSEFSSSQMAPQAKKLRECKGGALCIGQTGERAPMIAVLGAHWPAEGVPRKMCRNGPFTLA